MSFIFCFALSSSPKTTQKTYSQKYSRQIQILALPPASSSITSRTKLTRNYGTWPITTLTSLALPLVTKRHFHTWFSFFQITFLTNLTGPSLSLVFETNKDQLFSIMTWPREWRPNLVLPITTAKRTLMTELTAKRTVLVCVKASSSYRSITVLLKAIIQCVAILYATLKWMVCNKRVGLTELFLE